MTVAIYPLGRPLPPTRRGGDCRARDLHQGRNVHGRHRFAATDHCQISNGLLTVTVGASGTTPALIIAGHRGVVVVDDFYEDVYTDIYGGSYSTPEWLAGGTLVLDSPDVSAVLTAVRIARISAESVILRLRAPLMGDAYVVLRRGERMIRIQHGSTRAPLAEVARRIRWDGMVPGYATSHRIEETPPAMDSFPRFIAAIDPVTADGATFSLTSADVRSARFGAGIGTWDLGDRPIDMHRQMGDASRPRIVVTV